MHSQVFRYVAWFFLPFVLMSAVLSGCGGADTSHSLSGPGFSDVFAQLRQKSSSDFVRQVLDDDHISQAERDEARARFAECVNSSGSVVARDLGDGWDFTGPGIDTDEYRTVVESCDQKSGASTLSMYFQAMRDNPQNLDPYDLMALCLVKKGVVEPNYSAADYDRDLEAYFALPEDSRPPGVWLALSYSDRHRGPDVYDECSMLPAREVLTMDSTSSH